MTLNTTPLQSFHSDRCLSFLDSVLGDMTVNSSVLTISYEIWVSHLANVPKLDDYLTWPSL